MNEKALVERRTDCVEKINALFATAEKEERAFNDEELGQFNQLKADVEAIDNTIKAEKEARAMTQLEVVKQPEAVDEKVAEERAFEAFIRSKINGETRAVNLVDGSSGAILPKTIADRILEEAKNISPVFNMASVYRVKGDLVFPQYKETATTKIITMGYASEFSDLESTSGELKSVTLGGFLAGALTKVSKSLINNADFDVVGFTIRKVAEAVASFVEKEILTGSGSSAMSGIVSTGTNSVTAADDTSIGLADLIKVQMAVHQRYRDSANACWIMKTSTLQAIRLLQDADNRPLLQPDVRSGFGYSLLGAHVYESDSMPAIAASAKTVVYGDIGEAVAVRITPEVEMQVLQEKYAAQHAVGVVAWLEADSKVVNNQAVAYLTQAAS